MKAALVPRLAEISPATSCAQLGSRLFSIVPGHEVLLLSPLALEVLQGHEVPLAHLALVLWSRPRDGGRPGGVDAVVPHLEREHVDERRRRPRGGTAVRR